MISDISEVGTKTGCCRTNWFKPTLLATRNSMHGKHLRSIPIKNGGGDEPEKNTPLMPPDPQLTFSNTQHPHLTSLNGIALRVLNFATLSPHLNFDSPLPSNFKQVEVLPPSPFPHLTFLNGIAVRVYCITLLIICCNVTYIME